MNHKGPRFLNQVPTLHPQRVIGSLGSLEVSRSLQPDRGVPISAVLTSGSEDV